MINYILYKMCNQIIYPFPNSGNGLTAGVWEWISNFTTLLGGWLMLGLKLIHVSKRGTKPLHPVAVEYIDINTDWFDQNVRRKICNILKFC